MSDETCTDGTERWECDRCGKKETEMDQLIPVEIPLTGEIWDLCDPCVDDFVRWVEAGTDRGDDREVRTDGGKSSSGTGRDQSDKEKVK